MIEEVSDTLGLDSNFARALLLKFLWNKEQLIHSYMENENLVRQVLNVDLYGMKVDQDNSNKEIYCPVCYNETEQTLGMECGHKLCFDCYKDYLTSQISLGPDSVMTSCP